MTDTHDKTTQVQPSHLHPSDEEIDHELERQLQTEAWNAEVAAEIKSERETTKLDPFQFLMDSVGEIDEAAAAYPYLVGCAMKELMLSLAGNPSNSDLKFRYRNAMRFLLTEHDRLGDD